MLFIVTDHFTLNKVIQLFLPFLFLTLLVGLISQYHSLIVVFFGQVEDKVIQSFIPIYLYFNRTIGVVQYI